MKNLKKGVIILTLYKRNDKTEGINMKSFEHIITNPIGIHARPAGNLVKFAKTFDSEITVEKNGKEADAKKLFSLLSLGAMCQDKVTVKVEGPDEDAACEALKEHFIMEL